MKAPDYEHYLDLEVGKAIEEAQKHIEAEEAKEFLTEELLPSIASVCAIGLIIGLTQRIIQIVKNQES